MKYDEFKSVLVEEMEKIKVILNEDQCMEFYNFMQLLLEWNEKVNLTAITDSRGIILKHFVDSLTIAKYVKEDKSIIDMGTGAGFPGIPLKIAFPNLKITLMDSLNKRVKFLQSVIDALHLCDIEAVHGRAEEAARNVKYRECFDLCVSRAVANLSTLSEYTLPFVKVNGMCIPYKAAEVEEEVEKAGKAIQVLGGKLTAVKKIPLPDTDIERSFILIEKVHKTSKVYPRKAGTASKEPIQ